jgi:cell division septation protein DedD
VSDLPHETADDAFHEIQLSGKQLVFLFMATTVVSVVIFLCGVLVGRGVRVEGAAAAEASLQEAAAGAPDASSPAAAVAEPPAPTPEPSLSYPDRLEGVKPPAENLRRQSESARAERAPAPAAVVPDSTPEPAATEQIPASTPPPTAPASSSAAARNAGARSEAEADAKPASMGEWVVQVQALRDRGDAEAIAKRLRSKNYEAFVLAPDAGGPGGMYRVQVGRFKDRAAAEATARRLKQEEKFSPWVRR